MTAAIFAAREGAQVVLLEHKDRVGKKILSTGNGRCNLSNRLQEPFCYRSGQPDFPWKALGAFTLPMTLEYFEDLGVLTRERDGYLYPYSGQASAVLDALRLGLARESVQVVTECEVFSITPREDAKHRFEVKTSQGSFSGEALILAVQVRMEADISWRNGWDTISSSRFRHWFSFVARKSSLNSSPEYARMPL